MRFCYNLFENYGIAIILFTLFSKIVLLPMSIWVQKNSIKMVKMQPDINRIKINYFGDKDKIAEEQEKLYKQEKYNAFASIIPLLIQIVLLIGLAEVINHPLTHIIKIPSDISEKLATVVVEANSDLDKESSSLELAVVNDINANNNIEKYREILNSDETIENIKKLNFRFCGMDLTWISIQEGGISILIPIVAGLSALVMCIAQNMINVLQIQQSKANKYGMLIISVGLSLYLGAFVTAGIALYWIASNIFAVIQQWLLNIFINPKKYVDYEDLEKTTKQLKEMSSDKNEKRTKEQKRKEREDYSKFFKIVNKHLVFYSESNGFYKYYKGIIEYLLKNTNLTIHYITSDFNDNIFKMEKENPKIKAYYIGEKKLITLMMKLESDVVIMTMPDLENYHIKRSYIKKDIEYIYIPHGMDSLNLTMRKGSMDHFDTVFTTGKHQMEEAIKTNEVYNLKDRKLIEWGYSLLDDMIKDYNETKAEEKDIKTILIAPSWQKDNIVDLCLEELLEQLSKTKYQIIVRPHPQQVRHMKEKFDKLKEKYSDNNNIIIQTDFSSNNTVFNASLLITDWSGIAYEYAFTTKKPVIFIDTPMKIMNPEYKVLNIEPFNIWARDEIGQVVKVEQIDSIGKTIDNIFNNTNQYNQKIAKMVGEYVYNLGNSSEIGGKYIVQTIQNKIKEKRGEK